LLHARKPDKWFGRIFAQAMNRGHERLSDWGLRHITIESWFTILDVGCGGGRMIEKLAAKAVNGILLQIRPLRDNDPATMAAAFQRIGWRKTEAQYRRYLEEQAAERRVCLVALVEGRFAGYVTLNWQPTYPPFAEAMIPEIQDLNVLPEFQRQRIASRLLDEVEALAGERTSVVGIGVGLHPGYNAAQRLYGKRGYIPDGRGITHRDRFLEEGAQIVLDDDLVLHLTKQLRPDLR
jgi:GNAT superfamily N-acetyltransferase